MVEIILSSYLHYIHSIFIPPNFNDCIYFGFLVTKVKFKIKGNTITIVFIINGYVFNVSIMKIKF